MENRSERNRWIENFRRFSDLEELGPQGGDPACAGDYSAWKRRIADSINYQDEYEKASP